MVSAVLSNMVYPSALIVQTHCHEIQGFTPHSMFQLGEVEHYIKGRKSTDLGTVNEPDLVFLNR